MQRKVKKIVEKIIDNPDVGKPLRYELAGFSKCACAPVSYPV
jgi:hypothetical protein